MREKDMKKLGKIFKKKADYYDDALQVFDKYRESAYNTRLKLLMWLADTSMFTLLGAYDLWIVLIDFKKAQKKYQKAFYSRLAALLCFELLSDIANQLGENFKVLLLEKIVVESVNERATQLRQDFNKLRNDNESKFKNIRDFTIAHRDHDIGKQIKILNSLDLTWIIDFAFSFLEKIEELQVLFNDVIKEISHDSSVLGRNKFIRKYEYAKFRNRLRSEE